MHNDTKCFAGQGPQLETAQRSASFSAYVDEAVRQALRNQPAELPNDSTVLYHRSFPIGSALADIFAHRVACDDGMLSLIYLIEQLTGISVPDETPEQKARRGILCGLCWQLVGLLRMGANTGFKFNTHDEGRMLMSGVRRGRSSDAGIVRAMFNGSTADDELTEAAHE